MGFSDAFGLLVLVLWLYLFFLRGRFWRLERALPPVGSALKLKLPAVVALVPARNEAPVIARASRALAAQDYQGPFQVLVIDDASTDGTPEAVTKAPIVKVLPATDLPEGWTGKLWALEHGRLHLALRGQQPDYLWLVDADVEVAPDTLTRMVAKSLAEQREMVSLMVTLSCQRFWEKLLIPPFVYFFEMLYPFSWAADPKARTAAGAGGCLLVSGAALDSAGGFAALKGAMIDDCNLARLIKHRKGGNKRIWIGHAGRERALRGYPGLAGIWQMVARSAYSQLRHSPLVLVATLLGLTVTFIAPPVLTLGLLTGPSFGGMAALSAWGLMSVSFIPALRRYGLGAYRAPILPLVTLLYGAMTLSSALAYWQGRGGTWKGRTDPTKTRKAGT